MESTELSKEAWSVRCRRWKWLCSCVTEGYPAHIFLESIYDAISLESTGKWLYVCTWQSVLFLGSCTCRQGTICGCSSNSDKHEHEISVFLSPLVNFQNVWHMELYDISLDCHSHPSVCQLSWCVCRHTHKASEPRSFRYDKLVCRRDAYLSWVILVFRGISSDHNAAGFRRYSGADSCQGYHISLSTLLYIAPCVEGLFELPR